jgi:RNA polymerase subunit RPABC4/transcription elongation factor Spt4
MNLAKEDHMICLKCRAEIEDLSMYCPNCGAPQFTPKHDEEIVLELNDPMKSKVVIMEIDNMTSALSTLKNITGLSIAEIRNALKELPAVLMDHLSEEDALLKATELCTAGIKAEAVSGSVSINDHGETDEER